MRSRKKLLHQRADRDPKRSRYLAVGLVMASQRAAAIRVSDRQRRTPDKCVEIVFVERRARFAESVASTAGRGVSVMRWPWQSAPVEHRSSLTDQIVTALLTAATGGGARPALATSALETAATLYGSALASCKISGPSVVTRALDATWRAATASELIRRGQCVYIIGADPVDGLHLAPVSHWDVTGGPWPSSWVYRCERAGPSGTAWKRAYQAKYSISAG